MRRLSVCALMIGASIGAAAMPSIAQAAPNTIQVENALPGTMGWNQPFNVPAPAGSIAGYLGAVSAAPGQTVSVHASTAGGASFRVEVYRLGWYAGAGGRLLACLPSCSGSLAGQARPTPSPEAGTGLIRAGWPATTSFVVGNDWVSGYYTAVFVLTSGPNAGAATWAPLVVTAPPERPGVILVHATVTTWQAYNNWGGKSLYDYNSSGGQPARKVSFDRPYATIANTGMYDWEIPTVRWLEREGYDVAYATDIDTHRDPSLLRRYRLVFVNGHDEYWSTPVRDGFDAARDGGTNLAFFGANIGYWHVRFEDGERTMVGYKSAALDPATDPATETVQFRDLVPSRPECLLIGVQYMGGYSSNRTYSTVSTSLSDPWFSGTGFTAGSTIAGVVGYEWDTIVTGCNPAPTRTVFFDYAGSPSEQLPGAQATRYVASSGAIVFSTGTMDWASRLDPWSSSRDARVEAFTRNALSALTAAPPVNQPPVASFTRQPTSPTTADTVVFTDTSSDPDGTIQSRAWDLDNNGAFNDGTGTTANRTFPTAGTYTVRLQVTDNNGATAISTSTFTVTAAPPVNQPPVASFTRQPTSPTTADTVVFTDTSSDPDGTIQSRAWDLDNNGAFNDGTGTTANRTFPTPGTYTVRLQVTDNNGATAISTSTFTVTAAPPVNQPPVASFTRQPTSPTTADTVVFTDTSSDPDGTIQSRAWDLDNNGAFNDGTGTTANRTFPTPGSYTVRLQVTDNNGATAISTSTFTVTAAPPVNQPPVASFTRQPTSPTTADTVVFTDTSSDPDGTIQSRAWDLDNNGAFNDGTGTTANRTFPTPGTYTVRLQVTDNNGATAISTSTFTVVKRKHRGGGKGKELGSS